jgi:hypothetical protein
VGVLRLAQESIWRLYRVWHAKAMHHGRDDGTSNASISIEAMSRRSLASQLPSSVTYSLDLDIGEVALEYHLIARSVSLTAEDLFFEYAFVPELTEEAHKQVWLNMDYDADISPPNWNWVGAEGDVQYARPPLEARHAWFDFFPPDFVWEEHLGRRGQPDSHYLRNRIARLTIDLRTGEAQIEN